MSDPARPARLRWRCRRGMKELDLLLERFIEQNDAALTAGHWPELEALLETEDDLLWEWLQNPDIARVNRFRTLLRRIRREPQ